MTMPGRNGKAATGGGWAQGTTRVNGVSVSETLTIDTRTDNTPTEYKAATSIEFTDGFISSSTDEFTAFIADANNTSTSTNGNASGSGLDSYRYGFNGKELDGDIANDDYDYGARIYDGRIGRWLSLDPLQSKYPSLSAYNYCANSPIGAKDPDGKLIIFINGLWGWPNAVGGGGTENYWGAKWVSKVKDVIGDHKDKYYDGSLGGTGAILWNTFSLSQKNRSDVGEIKGYQDAKSIINSLDKDETIKIITNSMGAAFERGFTKGLFKYIDDRSNQINSELIVLGIMRNSLEKQIDKERLKTLNLNDKPTDAEKKLLTVNASIASLSTEKEKLQNVRVEMVIDLSPHQVTKPDPNADSRYFMTTGSSISFAESLFVQEKQVNFSTYLGHMDCHHSSGADPIRFPSAKKEMIINKYELY